MATAVPSPEAPNVVLWFGEILVNLTDQEFEELRRVNPHLRLERTAGGELMMWRRAGRRHRREISMKPRMSPRAKPRGL